VEGEPLLAGQGEHLRVVGHPLRHSGPVAVEDLVGVGDGLVESGIGRRGIG